MGCCGTLAAPAMGRATMSLYGTCNAQFGRHRCGNLSATWAEVHLPGPDPFLRRYRAFICPDHVAALRSQGARVVLLDRMAASA